MHVFSCANPNLIDLLFYILLVKIACFGRIHMAPFSDEYLFVEIANKVCTWINYAEVIL
jgi:hypothetical protein